MLYHQGGYVLKKIHVDKIRDEIDLEKILFALKRKFNANDKTIKAFIRGYSYMPFDNYSDEFEDNILDEEDMECFEEYNYYPKEYDLEEPIFVKRIRNYYYFILHHDYDVYICDYCNEYKFYDYKKYYANLKERYDNLALDKCPNCIKKQRRDNLMKGRQKLYENQEVPASKPQRYLAALLNGKLNYPIQEFYVDILLEDNIVLEYDGSGHWLSAVLNENMTEEDVYRRDLKRDKILQKDGYKIIRIESRKDYLPSDKEIKNIIKKARKEFSKGKKFYKVVIDDIYSKNELRKITDEDLKDVI